MRHVCDPRSRKRVPVIKKIIRDKEERNKEQKGIKEEKRRDEKRREATCALWKVNAALDAYQTFHNG